MESYLVAHGNSDRKNCSRNWSRTGLLTGKKQNCTVGKATGGILPNVALAGRGGGWGKVLRRGESKKVNKYSQFRKTRDTV